MCQYKWEIIILYVFEKFLYRSFYVFYLNIFVNIVLKVGVIIFQFKVFENFIVQNIILFKNCVLLNEWVDGWMDGFIFFVWLNVVKLCKLDKKE